MHGKVVIAFKYYEKALAPTFVMQVVLGLLKCFYHFALGSGWLNFRSLVNCAQEGRTACLCDCVSC